MTNDEGFYNRIEEGKEESEEPQDLPRAEFEKMVSSLLKEGWSLGKIVEEMSNYTVENRKIDKIQVLTVKKKFGFGNGESSEDVHMPLQPADDTLLKKIYDDAIETKNMDLVNKIVEYKLCGGRMRPEKKEEREKSTAEKFLDTVLTEMAKKIAGTGGKGEKEINPEESMQKTFEMYDRLQDRVEKKVRGYGSSLSGDANVAMAQVITPEIRASVYEITDTIREASGLKKKEKLQKSAETIIKEVEDIRKLYGKCPSCSSIVPKEATECVKCKIRFILPSPPTPQQFSPVPVTPPIISQIQAGQSNPNFHSIPSTESNPEGESGTESEELTEEEREVLESWLNEDDGYLYRLKRKIEGAHSPEKTAIVVWNILEDDDTKKKLLFIGERGVDWLVEGSRPYVSDFNVEELYTFYTREDVKEWVKEMFKKIQDEAKEEGIVLSQEDRKIIDAEFSEYLGGDVVEVPVPTTIRCMGCGENISTNIFSEHKCKQKKKVGRPKKEKGKKDEEKDGVEK